MLHKQQIGRYKLIEVGLNSTPHENDAHARALQIWQNMGGNRPELLISIERRLWETILKISGSASGGTLETLKSAFQDIYGLVGSDHLNVAEIDWFDPRK
jgi:hypothetical protein